VSGRQREVLEKSEVLTAPSTPGSGLAIASQLDYERLARITLGPEQALRDLLR
jgi:hypothetical protein